MGEGKVWKAIQFINEIGEGVEAPYNIYNIMVHACVCINIMVHACICICAYARCMRGAYACVRVCLVQRCLRTVEVYKPISTSINLLVRSSTYCGGRAVIMYPSVQYHT